MLVKMMENEKQENSKGKVKHNNDKIFGKVQRCNMHHFKASGMINLQYEISHK